MQSNVELDYAAMLAKAALVLFMAPLI